MKSMLAFEFGFVLGLISAVVMFIGAIRCARKSRRIKIPAAPLLSPDLKPEDKL